MKINKQIIKELSEYLDEFNLTDLEYTDKDIKVKVSKKNKENSNLKFQNTNVKDKNLDKESLYTDKGQSGIKITSPIIGTAYHAPEPGAKKFVEIGKKIKKGDTVMIIEAMKTMNHVPSTSDGVVEEICVEDGQAVEFGQPIIILK